MEVGYVVRNSGVRVFANSPPGPTAIVTHYFFLANFGWCFAVAFNFYQMIVRRNRESESFEKIYHGIAWVLNTPLLFLPFLTTSGRTIADCDHRGCYEEIRSHHAAEVRMFNTVITYKALPAATLLAHFRPSSPSWCHA